MTDIKNKVQNIDPKARVRDIEDFIKDTDNIYEALSIISSRARQLNIDIKQELHGKLEEFAVTSETIEEIQENKEQIEISKFYEKLPNPTLIATEEFLENKLEYRNRNQDNKDL
jgi:DNA-directed RNA polymerase subunit K/omega